VPGATRQHQCVEGIHQHQSEKNTSRECRRNMQI
jgi:hypothetical protein